jgi:DNA segregation ATPase FtsK/SpoIIIE, S-DNA-T family
MPRKKRKTSSKRIGKKRKYSKRKPKDQIEINPKVLRSIAALLFYLFGFLIILSFIADGLLLQSINRIVTALFGWLKYFVPFLFFFSGNLLLKPDWKLSRPTLLLGTLLLIISMASLFKSGSLGNEFWIGLSTLVSGLGAFLVFFVGLIIGLMVFWEISLSDVIKSFAVLGERITFSKNDQKTLFDEKSDKDFASDEGDWQDEPLIKMEADKDRKTAKIKDKNKAIPTHEPLAKGANIDPSKFEKPPEVNFVWKLPPLSLLSQAGGAKSDGGDIKKNAQIIEETLGSFGVRARIEEVHKGPTVTQYAVKPAIGTKLTKITSLSNDLALALAARTGQIRIEAPIPGKSLVGIEVPNISSSLVPLRKILSASSLRDNPSKLAVGLGVDVNNTPVIMDVVKLPHVLIAGQTGSGKSVAINILIMSILYRATPAEVKFILVDPKRVELSAYNNIPHLLTPVIVEPEKVISALRWAIEQMSQRYKIFAEVGARNIAAYNKMAGFSAMPYICIVIDELADIMLFSPSEVEDCINRLAQMARATGIHLILATQRPSVDIITGLIKANIPARISFSVSSMMDSRVILDSPGAEKLMGRGDMLFIPPDQAKPRRIQGTMVSDEEIKRVTDFLKKSGSPVQYTEEVIKKFKGKIGKKRSIAMVEDDDDRDELFEEVVQLICGYDKASASMLQRKFKIGYNRAARIIDQLHANGAISAQDGSKPREVLIKNPEEFIAQIEARKN